MNRGGSFAIAKRELASMLLSPSGWLAIAIFTILSAVFLQLVLADYSQLSFDVVRSNYQLSSPALTVARGIMQPLFGSVSFLLLLMLPLFTMRSIAAERNSGTLELLLSLPVTRWQIVFGKFLAMVAMLILLLSFFSTLWFAIAWFKVVPFGLLFTGTLGLFLAGCSFSALGIFVSSLTRNQLTAAAVSFGSIMFFWLAGLLVGDSDIPAAACIRYLSLFSHFEPFGAGLLDSRDVIYHLSFIGFFLYAATLRLNAGFISGGIRQLLTTLFIVVGLLSAVNFISSQNFYRADFTPEKNFTLSSQSKNLLSGNKQISVTAFLKSSPALRSVPRQLLEQYKAVGNFSYRMIDPDRQPLEAKKLKVERYDTYVVSVVGEDTGKNVRFTGSLSEVELTSAIHKALLGNSGTACFSIGHGERRMEDGSGSGYLQAAAELKRTGSLLKILNIQATGKVPDECSVVIIAGAEKKFFKTEEVLLEKYVAGGGGLFVMADPLTEYELPSFVTDAGIHMKNDMVLDKTSKQLGGDYTMPVVSSYDATHQITSRFNLMTIFPLARSLNMDDNLPEGIIITELASTLPSAWGESDMARLKAGKASYSKTKDREGPLPLAYAVEQGGKGRIVLVGDSDFASSAYIGVGGNRDMFLNMVVWLSGNGADVALRPRDNSLDPLILSDIERQGIALLFMILLPAFAALIGVAMFIKRRRF